MAVNFYSDVVFGDTLTVGSSSYTGAGILVTGSASDSTYDVLVGKRKFPRIRLIDDAAVGDTEFQIWNLGDELRLGENCSSSGNASLVIEDGDAALVKVNGQFETGGSIELGNASDTTIARSAAGTVEVEGNQVVTANVGTGNLMHIVLKDMQSYSFYIYNDDSWYSNGTGTLAILGSSTDPSAISSSNSEYQSRVPSYIAPQACVVKKLCFSFYWSSSAVNSADIDFGFSKFTPISDGTAASITMNKIAATDHNGSYTEVKPYYKTFTFSGSNATLAAGDAFAMHMRTTGGSSAQRVLVYATATLEIELT